MLFDFLDMMAAGSYEERRVGRYDDENVGLMVSTASVNDGAHPFETAVAHPEYNDGAMVIVEAYDTKEDAKVGHERWVTTMIAKELPKQLVDCCNSEVGQLSSAAGCETVYPRVSK